MILCTCLYPVIRPLLGAPPKKIIWILHTNLLLMGWANETEEIDDSVKLPGGVQKHAEGPVFIVVHYSTRRFVRVSYQ